MAEPLQDAALQKSLLPYARALMLREMMQWVFNNSPAEYIDGTGEMLEELAEIAAKKAEVAARRLASPPEPKQAPTSRGKRKNPGRQSKDEANKRISGTIVDMILSAELCMNMQHSMTAVKSSAYKPSCHSSWVLEEPR